MKSSPSTYLINEPELLEHKNRNVDSAVFGTKQIAKHLFGRINKNVQLYMKIDLILLIT